MDRDGGVSSMQGVFMSDVAAVACVTHSQGRAMVFQENNYHSLEKHAHEVRLLLQNPSE